MTWKRELKAAILRYVMRHGRLDATQYPEGTLKTYMHLRSRCEPDVAASAFTSVILPGDCLHEPGSGLLATITCACGELKGVTVTAEADIVTLLAGITED